MRKYNPKNYYVGGICEKHPEAGGLRTISRRTCVDCNRERVAKHRKLVEQRLGMSVYKAKKVEATEGEESSYAEAA